MESIQNPIHEVRGEKVMLDYDLAELYDVETRVFNQAIKRNEASFPKDFMFRLTANEWNKILSSNSAMMDGKSSGHSSQIVMSS